jgi:hypothetical protein
LNWLPVEREYLLTPMRRVRGAGGVAFRPVERFHETDHMHGRPGGAAALVCDSASSASIFSALAITTSEPKSSSPWHKRVMGVVLKGDAALPLGPDLLLRPSALVGASFLHDRAAQQKAPVNHGRAKKHAQARDPTEAVKVL